MLHFHDDRDDVHHGHGHDDHHDHENVHMRPTNGRPFGNK